MTQQDLALARCRVGRAEIDCLSWDDAVARVLDLAMKRDARHLVVTPNIQHLALLESEESFREVYTEAALVLADGAPVVFAMRIIRQERQPRITGADLLPALCELAAGRGLSVGFVGGRRGAADEAARRLVARHPALKIALVRTPPWGFEQDAKAVDALLGDIASADPDLLFVGLGSPKQEHFLKRHQQALGTGVALGIGAGIDYMGGAAPRAPKAFRRVGCEWLWRLLHEPRRLSGRYLTSGLVFLRVVGPQLLSVIVSRSTARIRALVRGG